MRIDGLKTLPVTRVVLDDFFEEPTYVDIKIISPLGRAQIRETVMGSFTIGDLDAKGKAGSVKTKVEGMADREMKTRDLKLKFSFSGTNIKVEGKTPEWNTELWAAIDESNPLILEKVIGAIDKTSKFGEDGEANPT